MTRLRAFGLLAVLLCASADAVTVKYSLTVNADGTFDTAFPTGNKGVGGGNDAPIWVQTPNPSCVEGVPSSFNLVPNFVDDPDDDALTLTSEGTAFPTGVTLDDTNDQIDCGTGTSVGTTTGHIIGADDGTASRVDSDAFPIVVVAAPAASDAAFPGCEGFGCDTQHARDASSVVCQVTNTDDSGSGSLRACLLGTTPRYIIFRTGGTIILETQIELGAAHSNFYLAGQTAPGGGIQVRASNTMTEGLLQLGHRSGSDPSGGTSDAVVRYMRLRHGSLGSNVGAHDNIQIFAGSNNLVFDHNSIQGTGDEQWSIWLSGNGGPSAHDITFSRNLWGEGSDSAHNLGPLFSGGGLNESIYNITVHHNVGVHTSYRHYKQDTGSGGIKGTHNGSANASTLSDSGASFPAELSGAYIYNITDGGYGLITANTSTTVTATLTGGTQNDWDSGETYIIANRGSIFINNVHFNTYSSEYSWGQNFYSGCSAIVVDVINDYFKAGPNYTTGRWPMTVSRGATHNPPSGCPSHQAVSVHFNGSEARLLDDTDAPKHNDNNYSMVTKQFGPETWAQRSAEILTQPEYAITRSTAEAAYTDLVTNENVGANKPSQDSVDARLLTDIKESGTCDVATCGYVEANAVGNNGWPTLAAGTAPTDTDGDGVPDAYETSPLGTDPNVSENQAVEDHDADGIPNIEEWINSL